MNIPEKHGYILLGILVKDGMLKGFGIEENTTDLPNNLETIQDIALSLIECINEERPSLEVQQLLAQLKIKTERTDKTG